MVGTRGCSTLRGQSRFLRNTKFEISLLKIGAAALGALGADTFARWTRCEFERGTHGSGGTDDDDAAVAPKERPRWP